MDLTVWTGLVWEEDEVVVEVPLDLGPGEAGDPRGHRGLGAGKVLETNDEIMLYSRCPP